MSFLLQWSYGNDIMNANRIYLEGNVTNRPLLNQFKSYADRWTEDNPDSKLFRAGGAGPTGYYSSRTLEDGSFLRLANANITYTFPSKICKALKMQNLSVYVSGQNLWVWTQVQRHGSRGFGTQHGSYSRIRLFGLSACQNVRFWRQGDILTNKRL